MSQSLERLFESHAFSRDRETFVIELLSDLVRLLQDSVGVEETESFISLVGGRIGRMMDEDYRSAVATDRLSLEQVSAALVDLKRRIKGGFSIESLSERQIILVNTDCPFGNAVIGRHSLCMMTSNVFGRIAADNLGYAAVDVKESIANGDARCRVVIDLEPGGGSPDSRMYYG